MSDIDEQTKRGYSSLGLVIVFGAIILFLFILSEDAVNHPIHAIELENGRYIHGSSLSCSEVEGASHRHQCRMTITDKELMINASRRFMSDPNGPLICGATFGSETVSCTAAYITSSYWENGIRLSGSTELENALADLPAWRTWRGIFYGWDEYHYVQFGATLAILFTLLTFSVLLKRSLGQVPLPNGLVILLITTGLLFSALFLAYKLNPQLIEITGHIYWEIWGLPILFLTALLAAPSLISITPDLQNIRPKLASSIVLSAACYFVVLIIIFILLLTLDFID